MKASLIQIYVLGLLLAITFSQQSANTNITLPPYFVIINENFTLYYQFNATAANATTNNTSTPPTDVTNATTPPTNATDTSTNATSPNQNNSGTIDLYMVYQGHHWFALGFSINGTNVTNATTVANDTTNTNGTTALDYVVVDIVNETIVVSDQYSPDIGLPTPDTNHGGKNDWTLVNYSMDATTMIVHVTRLQNTGDPLDFVFTGPGNYTLTWLYSPSLTIQGYQGDGARGVTNVTLVDINNTVNVPPQQLQSIACNMTLCPNGSNTPNPACAGCVPPGNHGIRLASSPILFILGVLWYIL